MVEIVNKAREFCEDQEKIVKEKNERERNISEKENEKKEKNEEERKMSVNTENKENKEEEQIPESEEEEEEEFSKSKKEKGVLATNISRNKKVIFYYIGVFIVNIVVRGSNLLALVIPDSAIGLFINGIATDGVLLITFLAPWIFGGREALKEEKAETKRIKVERTGIGKELSWERIKNEGLRISNELQATVMEQNDLKPYRYTPPADVGIGSEVKEE